MTAILTTKLYICFIFIIKNRNLFKPKLQILKRNRMLLFQNCKNLTPTKMETFNRYGFWFYGAIEIMKPCNIMTL